MSNYDYSGIDERRGRWWGLSGGVLLLMGALLVIALFAVALTFLFTLAFRAD